eukprot:GHVS01099467.1.p2 GENE.GHVS01099467.1~~GHVS01099467.1.p2  ORF type:complete len:290 (+),score=69.93 GHVS01099467.1:314-1183(+)
MNLSLPFIFVLGLVAIVLTATQTNGLAFKGAVEAWKEMLEELRAKFKDLAENKERKKYDIKGLESEIAENQNAITKLTTALNELAVEMEELREDYRELIAYNEAAKGEVKTLTENRPELIAYNEKKKKEIETIDLQMEGLTEDIIEKLSAGHQGGEVKTEELNDCVQDFKKAIIAWKKAAEIGAGFKALLKAKTLKLEDQLRRQSESEKLRLKEETKILKAKKVKYEDAKQEGNEKFEGFKDAVEGGIADNKAHMERLKEEMEELEGAEKEEDKCFKALNDAVEGHGRR